MRTGRVIAALVGAGVVCAGCTSQKRYAPVEPVKVTVRFFAPSPEEAMAAVQGRPTARLVSDTGGGAGGFEAVDWDAQHVVLWGGEFHGQNVTHGAAPLASGPYMFAYFDPDNGAAYQGWIAVNNGGDDLASAMAEWRDTVRAEQEWLAFENKLDGNFTSRDPNDFNKFAKELRALKSLEARIDSAARAQAREQYQRAREQVALLDGADVLLMPGEPSMLTPATRPAFNESELSLARAGQSVTKIVLAGDYARTMEKLRRATEMQGDLKRCRSVFNEQVRRYENRGHYYRLTDHIYHHGAKFVQNEQRLQNAIGQISRIDQQLADNGQRVHALLFVAGLFDADEAFKVFDQQQAALERERVVLEAQKCRLDRMFDDLDEMSERRIAVERQRQNLLAEMDQIERQQQGIEQSRVAIGQLRQSTQVIHRQGPACVLAASFVGSDLPAKVVDAVSRESLMTVRLEAAEAGFNPPGAVTDAANRPWWSHEAVSQGTGFSSSTQYSRESQVTFEEPNRVNEQWTPETNVASPERMAFDQPSSHDQQWAGHEPQTADEPGRYEEQSPQVVLASHREPEPPAKTPQTEAQQKAGRKESCPWFIKLLVPPCWIHEMINEKETP